MVFIFHFIVNNTNNIVSEYKKKIYKEYLLPDKDVLQTFYVPDNVNRM